jgi:hypothetical protein
MLLLLLLVVVVVVSHFEWIDHEHVLADLAAREREPLLVEAQLLEFVGAPANLWTWLELPVLLTHLFQFE